ncbi:carboxy terminal-processing peptidase [Lysobacter hankyongensis]|uniref:Carboxy terminal-processing peptidase n=2 Tax=Lysobacter hankyongensis TaxID=1176535 RepID=A0ABP9AWG8_9GAMM
MKVAKVLPVSLLALALTAPVAWLTAQADAGNPSAEQATAAKLVYGLLSDSRYAYRPRALDDKLSAEVFKRYLESLDPGKLFFTAGDIAKLEGYRSRLDDAIKSGEVAPAFEIFSLYQTRVNERVAHARALLKQDIFSFEGNDRWEYDREDAPWSADTAELDRLWQQSVRNDWLRLKLAGKQPDEIRKTLDKRYANMSKNVGELNGIDAFQTFLNAYATSIDPHTDYFDPRAAERFEQSMSLSLEGIGAQLQKQDDVVVIRELIPGGPAILSGKLKAGDRIVGVGQGDSGPMEDVIGWRIDDVVDKIKGPKGTQVRLDIVPAEAVLDSKPNRIVLNRAKIRLEEQAAKGEVLTIPGVDGAPARRIGVIKLPAFYQDWEGRRRNSNDYASATRDVERLLREFRGERVDGVVMDLRNNGGGSLDEAVAITGLFIDKGPVVQAKASGGDVRVDGDTASGVVWDGPLAVLINRGSASASEIFAGAIQDYGRGLIIGETSFGKGTVQNLVDLDRWPMADGKRFGQVKLTIAQFFLPGGSSTQNKGVVPDIKFPVTVDASEYGESTLDNALPWDRIAAVPYVRYGDFGPLLPRLEALHNTRIAADREFRWWSEDIAQFRAENAKKWVSLNEAERRAERDRDAAKRKLRQEERKALGLDLDPLGEDTDDGLTSNERDIAQDAAREKAAEKRPDPLLRESAAILADAVRELDSDKPLSAQVLLTESRKPGQWAN